MLRRKNILICLTAVVVCLSGIALAKAVKVDLLPYESFESFASGQVVLSYAKGADKTEVQVNCWDLIPEIEYNVYLYNGGWYSIGTFMTGRNGSGNLHVSLEGKTSEDVAVTVQNLSNGAFALLGPDGAPSPPGGKTRCFLADTPVWINGALIPISQVAAGRTVGKICSLGQIEKLEEHEGCWEYRGITLESGNHINVVDAHRFMLASGQWVAAQNLKKGMKLKSLHGTVAIKSVETRIMPCVGKVYNIKVSGSDRYLVGRDGVVVRDY